MLKSGARVAGKWTGTAFQVERPLGVGANGQVYLVRTPNGRAAMKVCPQSGDIAREWAHLERLSPSNMVFPRPMLIDDEPPHTFFYVMEWIAGEPFQRVLPRLDSAGLIAVMRQMIDALDALHATGHAFCDLKPDNILVSTSPSLRVRFVDVGGITPFGRSVRQFTPFYDRAFWGLGGRRADASYDLCACALCVLFAIVGEPPLTLTNRRPEERKAWLDKTMKRYPDAQVATLLRYGIVGRVTDAKMYARLWANPTLVTSGHQNGSRGVMKPPVGLGQSQMRAAVNGGRKHRDWTEWVMWLSLGTAATVTLAAWISFLGWFG